MKKIIALVLLGVLLCGCAPIEPPSTEDISSGTPSPSTPSVENIPLQKTGSMELRYATEFSVDYFESGYKMLTIGNTDRFLIIPEGKQLPKGMDSSIKALYQPIQNIYLAATASMCLFDALERLDTIRLSGTKADGWYIENAANAMNSGSILFAGKYSEPDYELMLREACPLAIESTMIGHASDIKEKLEELGIAVLIDQSSNESHPLGRTEWIKLYGALLNEEEKAEALFQKQAEVLDALQGAEPTGKTVAFFYISSAGRVVARRSGDYVANLISLAGGTYVFENLGDPDSKMSTVTIEMETFFAAARDADYLIYNSTIGGEVSSLSDLLKKNPLMTEFKAVQNGNVWCTGKNMYQETTGLGEMLGSFHKVFTGEADNLMTLPYLYRLK